MKWEDKFSANVVDSYLIGKLKGRGTRALERETKTKQNTKTAIYNNSDD